jgi:hypothetical protein
MYLYVYLNLEEEKKRVFEVKLIFTQQIQNLGEKVVLRGRIISALDGQPDGLLEALDDIRTVACRDKEKRQVPFRGEGKDLLHDPVVNVDLVRDDDDGDALPVLVQLLEPFGEVIVRRLPRDVEAQDAAVGLVVVGRVHGAEPLLARGVPKVHAHLLLVHFGLVTEQRQRVGGKLLRLVFVHEEPLHKLRFAHGTVAEKDDLHAVAGSPLDDLARDLTRRIITVARRTLCDE